MRRRLSVAFFFLAALIGQSGRAQAAPIFWAGNGHYYEIVNVSTTWAAALAAGDAATFDPGTGVLDGYLVTITSAAEDSFLSSAFGATNTFWAAATDQVVEGTWRWAAGPENGTLLSFFDWGPGEPNNSGNQDFLIANWFFTPGLWDDQGGTAAFRYVIEYSAAPATAPEPASLLLFAVAVATTRQRLMALCRRASASPGSGHSAGL